MDRVIKFRAWDGCTMFNVDVMGISPCSWDCPDYGKRGVSLAYQPHIAVMQFTGLTDKNGKEIYEGDITRQFTENTNVVIFKDGAFGYMVDEEFISFTENSWFQWNDGRSEEIKIIGNVWENPELIEKAQA